MMKDFGYDGQQALSGFIRSSVSKILSQFVLYTVKSTNLYMYICFHLMSVFDACGESILSIYRICVSSVIFV